MIDLNKLRADAEAAFEQECFYVSVEREILFALCNAVEAAIQFNRISSTSNQIALAGSLKPFTSEVSDE